MTWSGSCGPVPADKPKQEVYVVTKNADFTEGRGPMLFHKVFSRFLLAEDYIMKQEGIYGSKQGRSGYGCDILKTGFNGYDIIRVEVQDKLLTLDEETRIKDDIVKLETQLETLRKKLK